jgi:hypothetical protein
MLCEQFIQTTYPNKDNVQIERRLLQQLLAAN